MQGLIFVAFGVVIAMIARWMVPGLLRAGLLTTIFVGTIGALLGGFLGIALGMYRQGHPAGFLMSAAGAILLLAAHRLTATGGTSGGR
jgi:uncharacterized membrane protein YeaQ/YmgE (transglycosylase-associated protein family)